MFSLLIFAFTACQTGSKFEPHSAEEAFNEGVRLFDEREYTEALSYLDMIKLQYPGSNIADKAQYYTAEINFARKEYILASFNYSRVRNAYPGSQYAKVALFKAGLSQYLMIPSYYKDQEYTRKAIKTLQDYQFFYPEKDSLYYQADTMIVECRDVLGEKEYMTAELYKTLESPRSALIYYESVIQNYDDTQYFEPAWFGKIAMLYWMKRYEEAKNATLTYNNLFPNGKNKANIGALEQKSKIEQVQDAKS
jgi:outer membrane protein assembly factor BamD